MVAGAGMAGLSAAYALEKDGADVFVAEARDRVGGRVWTIRDGFEHGQHAEAGADLIEAEQSEVLELARELGLKTSRILRRGIRLLRAGRRWPAEDAVPEDGVRTICRAARPIGRGVQAERKTMGRRDRRTAGTHVRGGVARWRGRKDEWLKQRVRALRGLFLADPERLSLLMLVEFFADDSMPPDGMMRIADGNDRLATGLARRLRKPPTLKAILRRVRQDERGVTATVDVKGKLVERSADFLVCTLPPTTTRDVVFEPVLPDAQRRAIETVDLGPATRVLLQFDRRFWRRAGQASAFGSPYAFGAVWDGNEQQRGTAGILSLLAGGAASGELQEMLEHDGTSAVVPHLCVARPAGESTCRAHDHLGTRSVGERRLRLLRHVLQAVRSRRPRASRGSRALRRRAHERFAGRDT